MSQNDKYINEDDNVVPKNTIVIVCGTNDPNYINEKHKEIIEDFRENPKRERFQHHHYYCLPLVIGNQYGFGIKSLYDFTAIWNGEDGPNSIDITIKNKHGDPQIISSHFGHGIITVSNYFSLRTEPGMNLMVMPPPNYFIPNLVSMTAVVEADNIRRDFTFNLQIVEPNKKVIVKKGDVLAAFMPIQRYFIDNFSIKPVGEIFNNQTIQKEIKDMSELGRQRDKEDPPGPPFGRKYFKGIHAFGEKFKDHQIKVKKP
jgi:hypothetical protein